ncbi:hypothetical protein EC968_007854 [Mortierella alpina]|nr:hypothetical protein EC968_007854 [Mortierella alpina]
MSDPSRSGHVRFGCIHAIAAPIDHPITIARTHPRIGNACILQEIYNQYRDPGLDPEDVQMLDMD